MRPHTIKLEIKDEQNIVLMQTSSLTSEHYFFLNQCSTFLLEYACRYVPCLNIYNVYNINVQSANDHVDNPSDYWNISLYLVR
jgi:hypothetical protein